ncbi:MAG TPA: rhodanese-related sulfurtransferase [Candidatus Binatia bacterium]|nr:rhodanese-related sulfurtransferase [Candidatus Binatia bacterium]
MNQQIVLLYYKYVDIARPKDIMIQQRAFCSQLGLKGRILIAREGINGTVEGTAQAVEKYIEYMESQEIFKGISYKKSEGDGNTFPKLVVKVRREIVTSELGDEDVNPNQITGEYLSAEELHQWYEEGKDFYVVDMRNDYEQTVGHFEGSILPGMENFRDLKKATEKLSYLKDKNVITVCTGGVRCEKASGYLVSKGFKKVYQLKDGIVTYMEKFPNKHFKGKLYVFDQRIVMGFNTDSPEHEIIGRCELCKQPSENYVNCADPECHKHFICCINCLINGLPYCKPECLSKIKNEKSTERVAV